MFKPNWKGSIYLDKKFPLPNTASFLMTEDCPLRCTYCFERKRANTQMKPEVIHRALEYLYENAKTENKKEVSITVFGGEPLLEPDLIRILFDKGLELQDKYNIEFKAGIITSGFVMNDKIKQLLLDYKDKVNMGCQVSVDGKKEIHDLCRVTKSGRGTFNTIEKNMQVLKEIFKNNRGMLHVHGCISKNSLPHLFESYKFFRENWDIPKIWFMPVHEEEWEESDVSLYKGELEKISEYILEKVKESNSIEEMQNYSPLNKCFERRTVVNPPCSAGKTYITVTANGDIYPCHHFYFNDTKEVTKLGDIWDGIDLEKQRPYVEITNDDMTCENKCSIFNCYRCLGTNWVHNGDMRKQIRGYYCQMAHVENEVILSIRSKLGELGLIEKERQYSLEESIDLLAQASKYTILEIQDIKQKLDLILEKLLKEGVA